MPSNLLNEVISKLESCFDVLTTGIHSLRTTLHSEIQLSAIIDMCRYTRNLMNVVLCNYM